MRIVSEIQRGVKKEGPSICITAHLDETQKKEIRALGQACKTWDGITQEPFLDNEENADPTMPCFYIYYENTFPLSFLSVFSPDGKTAEITGFTLPGYRQCGYFKELLETATYELRPYHFHYYIVTDGKSKDTQDMLYHLMGAEGWALSHSEMMMSAPMETLAALETKWDQNEEQDTDAADTFSVVMEEDAYVLYQKEQIIGRCKLAFFPGTAYLYGFTIEKPLRRRGYGRLFLKKLAQYQLQQNQADLNEQKSDGSVLELPGGGIHTMLLQVGSLNEAACGLYQACGFTVTEQLDYYEM